MDACKTIERIVSSFSPAEQPAARTRLAKSFRYIVCQRLMSTTGRNGRVAAFEILKANARTRECIEKGEREDNTLLAAMKAGASEGMQYFDGELARLVQGRVVDLETALSVTSNPAILGQELAR
jgi:twitching motility protein PilT